MHLDIYDVKEQYRKSKIKDEAGQCESISNNVRRPEVRSSVFSRRLGEAMFPAPLCEGAMPK